MSKKGIVYLVGAGPGDEELITVKGLRLLGDCEVVVYDRLVSSGFLEKVPVDCEKINVGKRVGDHAITQEEINRILVQKGLEGKRIVRLKGGDPFVFGRGGEEIMALQEADIPYEVVPGVTSAIAAATYAGIPITHRGISQSFHVITGYTITTESGLTDNFNILAKLEGTLVFLMGMGNLPKITEGLLRHGKDPSTPVAIISRGTTPYQRQVRGTLETITNIVEDEKLEAPAAIVIGKVTALELLYHGRNSLIGKRVGLMMTDQLANKMAKLLYREGAKVIKLGASEIKVYKEEPRFLRAVENLDQYGWVVFTSTNAANIFFEMLKERQIDHRKLMHLKFAVVGSGTKEALQQKGFVADYMPEKFTAKELGKGLSRYIDENDYVLIPRAERGSEELITSLKTAEIIVDDIKIYDTVINEEKLLSRLEHIKELDYIVFGSSAGVEGFIEKGGERAKALMKESQIVCIGEITAQTLLAYGYKDILVADTYTAESVIRKMGLCH